MFDQTEPRDAAGVVNNPDASDDAQFHKFVNLKKKKAVGMAKSESFWHHLTPLYMVGVQGLNVRCFFTCHLCGDELTCSNPSQTADHQAGNGIAGFAVCSRMKQKSVLQRSSVFQEQSRKRASHCCCSALAARLLLSIHTPCCANERNWSFWGYSYSKGHNRLTIERADKWVYIKQNSPNMAELPCLASFAIT
jgi:hypothetical protein